MKKIILSIVLGGSVAILSSCNNEEAKVETEEIAVEKCSYSVDPTTIKVDWTSYKFTEKVAVGGTFDMIELNNTVIAETAVEAFKNATISINSRTVNSDSEERDGKIKTSFFGSMEKSDFLTGKIVSIEGEEKGSAVIAITMNGVEKNQSFEWTLVDNVVEFKAELALEDWNAKASVDALNAVCDDLHKGADGLSVLWSTVTVSVSAELNKSCE